MYGEEIGGMSKIKSSNIDRIVWKVHGMSRFVFCIYTRAFIPIPTVYSLYRNPLKTKHAEFQIVVQFWNIFVYIATNIITLRTFLTDDDNK